jgi:hypothetical protein
VVEHYRAIEAAAAAAAKRHVAAIGRFVEAARGESA